MPGIIHRLKNVVPILVVKPRNKFFLLLLFTVILSLSNGRFSSAQTNLLYNGDFELYDTCPITESMPIDYQIEHCLGWKAPTFGTSDFFHTCGGPNVDVPVNALGYQLPYSGNGYLGLFAATYDGGFPGGNHWWEYIQGQFVVPLESGKGYAISFYVSFAAGSTYTIDQIGAHISASAVTTTNSYPLALPAQIESPDGYFFLDTTAWVKVEGVYIASGGERFITIGNFNDSITTDSVLFNNFDPTFHACYFYIDGASVVDLTELPLEVPNCFSPNNDGSNDVFSIQNLSPTDEVFIFNRWGTLIYKFNGYKDFWDGRNTAGEECTSGTYYYIVSNKTSERKQKGFVHLMR